MIVPHLYTDDVTPHIQMLSLMNRLSVNQGALHILSNTHASKILKTIRMPVHTFTFLYLGFGLILSSHPENILVIQYQVF